MLCLVLVLPLGCEKKEVYTTEIISLQDLAKEHSSALDYFYRTSVEQGFVFDVGGIKSFTRSQNVIDEEKITQILSGYHFISNSLVSLPVVQTKSGDAISEEYADALDIFLEEIVSDESFASLESFTEFVISSIERIDDIDILKEYPEFTKLALYILIDSYDYWINQDKFAEWVTTICTPEQQYQIACALGHPELVGSTRSSGAEMRAWAEMCKSNDEATNGFLSAAIKSDSWGLAGSAVGGALFGGLGVASCLFGPGWSSIGTLMGI